MSKYYSGTLQKGSKGDEVKKWQGFLNSQGYNLSVDGDFGDNTYNATIDWQGKNGLGTDGIVGKNTWGKAGYTLSPSSQSFEYGDFEYGDYTESDAVKQSHTNKSNAENAVTNYGDYTKSDEVIAAESNKSNAENAVTNYGDFNYDKQGTFDDIINKILNREKFSYDLNGDALYQQYKDKYIQQGKMAMQDTMGQAAAMTGGYGNSYAASVGNQAYQAQLNNLNDIIPELYQMAYDKYNQEGQDLYNQYGMLSDDRNMQYGMWGDKYNQLVADRGYYSNEANNAYVRDYGEWSDKYNQLIADRGYYSDEYNNERNYDYNKYATDKSFEYGKYSDDKSYAYQQHRDTVSDEQWQKTFDEGVRQFNESQAAKNASGGSGGGSGGGGGDTEFHKAVFAREDENGNHVYYINGKEYTYAKGINPYTGTKNSDVKNGTFSNGYQPNNVKGQKLSKTGLTDVVNGVTQNVWQTPDGQKWIWDGTQNKYLKYED